MLSYQGSWRFPIKYNLKPKEKNKLKMIKELENISIKREYKENGR